MLRMIEEGIKKIILGDPSKDVVQSFKADFVFLGNKTGSLFAT